MDPNTNKPLPSILQGPPTGAPKRKPLPASVVAVAPSATVSSSSSSTGLEKIPEPIITPSVAADVPQYTVRKWSWDWNRFSKKKKRIVVGALIATVCLLALIVGLAVGLTKGHGKGPSNLPLPTSNGGPYQGDLTYYDPGLGSCGITSTDSEMICAVSHVLFDAASTSANPNNNPLCGLKLRIRRGDKSVDVKIVDRCPGCKVDDLDVSPAVFQELAELAEGRVVVNWSWLEASPVSMG